jgi:hypothetical protein
MNPTNHLGVLYNDAVNGAAQNSYFEQTPLGQTRYLMKKIGDHKINGVIGTELLQNQVITTLVVLEIICCLVKIQNIPKQHFSPVTINDVSVNGADWLLVVAEFNLSLLERNMIIKKNTYLLLQCELMGHPILLQKIDGLSIIIRGLGNYKRRFYVKYYKYS